MSRAAEPVAEVVAYFERRRALASATMRMHPGALIEEGDAVAQFVAGSAEIGGEPVSWQTFGIYRLDTERGQVREVWLVPLDAALFDRIWTAGCLRLTPDSGGQTQTPPGGALI